MANIPFKDTELNRNKTRFCPKPTRSGRCATLRSPLLSAGLNNIWHEAKENIIGQRGLKSREQGHEEEFVGHSGYSYGEF